MPFSPVSSVELLRFALAGLTSEEWRHVWCATGAPALGSPQREGSCHCCRPSCRSQPNPCHCYPGPSPGLFCLCLRLWPDGNEPGARAFRLAQAERCERCLQWDVKPFGSHNLSRCTGNSRAGLSRRKFCWGTRSKTGPYSGTSSQSSRGSFHFVSISRTDDLCWKHVGIYAALRYKETICQITKKNKGSIGELHI